MENATRRCSVFLTPAGNDFVFTDLLIRELGATHGAPFFEPHVTVYTGTFDEITPIIRALAEIAPGTPPLSLRISGIGCTVEYFKTLYLQFEEDQRLRAIHDQLTTACGDSGYRLNPHLSLMYKEMPLREKQAIANSLHLDRTELRFDRMKLVTPRNQAEGWRDTLNWETLATFIFGKI